MICVKVHDVPSVSELERLGCEQAQGPEELGPAHTQGAASVEGRHQLVQRMHKGL